MCEGRKVGLLLLSVGVGAGNDSDTTNLGETLGCGVGNAVGNKVFAMQKSVPHRIFN